MDNGVILYGAGACCKWLYKILKEIETEVLAIVDSDPKKWGLKIGECIVTSPEEIRKFQDKRICITVADKILFIEISEMLQSGYGYKKEQIISCNRFIIEAYCRCTFIREYIVHNVNREKTEHTVLFDSIVGLGLGGVEAWTMDICKVFIENNAFRVHIISDNKEYNIQTVLKDYILKADINHDEAFALSSVMSLVKLIIAEMPCKVITSATNEVMLAAYLVKKCYPEMIEIISVVHNSNEKVYQIYTDFQECPDIFIGVSQDIKQDIITRGIGFKNVHSMTCPFACEKTLVRTYTQDKMHPIHIGYAGRMDGMECSQKRMDLLLCFAKTLAERKIHFTLELAGEGPAKKQMETLIREYHLEKEVIFVGTLGRDEMPRFWRRQDICINLADYEGRSISIIEAMGNGAVPVVTATSGVRDDIIDNSNGYIVPIGEYIAAADKVEYLYMHRERLSEMGRAAHDIVYPKSLMEPHIAFWERILGGRTKNEVAE